MVNFLQPVRRAAVLGQLFDEAAGQKMDQKAGQGNGTVRHRLGDHSGAGQEMDQSAGQETNQEGGQGNGSDTG
jgi:hypothetical protein